MEYSSMVQIGGLTVVLITNEKPGLKSLFPDKMNHYRKTSYISRTLVGN